MNNIEAFILVGGRSSRMGRDKASILINGISMAERTAWCIKGAIPNGRITLIGGNSVHAQLVDEHPGRGPWSGLGTALSNSRSTWTFVMACDYPLMSSDVIRSITAKASDEVDAIVPTQADGKLQPLCSMFRTDSCRAMVQSVLAGDTTPPLLTIFDKVRTHVLPFADLVHLVDAEIAFLNVNCEADLEKAVLLLEARQRSMAK